MNELNVSRYKGAQAWNRSCSVVNRRKTELSFAHARFLLRHYAHARTDRAGIPDRVPTAPLQVHQAKVLKQLHEGGADPGVLQELRTATDLALRATKVTARALGQTMSTLVVQERHLWLTLADMRESDKHRFLDFPISQAGLFGEAVENFAHQFSAAQKQTEAFRHILPRRSAAVSTQPSAAASPSARRRGCPPAASTSAPARPQRGAGLRKSALPASAPAKPVKCQGRRRP